MGLQYHNKSATSRNWELQKRLLTYPIGAKGGNLMRKPILLIVFGALFFSQQLFSQQLTDGEIKVRERKIIKDEQGLVELHSVNSVNKLLAQARTYGSIKLRVVFGTEFTTRDARKHAENTLRYEGIRKSIISDLGPRLIKEDRSNFPGLPEITVTVDAIGLQQLINDPRVIYIESVDLSDLTKEEIKELLDKSYSADLILSPEQAAIVNGSSILAAQGATGAGETIFIIDVGHLSSSGDLTQEVLDAIDLENSYCFSRSGTFESTTYQSSCAGGATSQEGVGAAVIDESEDVDTEFASHTASLARQIIEVSPDVEIIIAKTHSRIYSGGEFIGFGSTRQSLQDALGKAIDLANEGKNLTVLLPASAFDDPALQTPASSFSTSTYWAHNLIGDLEGQGVPVILAAGNSGSEIGVQAPAHVQKAITVGSTRLSNTEERADLSNYNQNLDMVDMMAAVGNSFPFEGISFAAGNINGTSWAAAIVAAQYAAIISSRRAFMTQQNVQKDVQMRLILNSIRDNGAAVTFPAGGSSTRGDMSVLYNAVANIVNLIINGEFVTCSGYYEQWLISWYGGNNSTLPILDYQVEYSWNGGSSWILWGNFTVVCKVFTANSVTIRARAITPFGYGDWGQGLVSGTQCNGGGGMPQ